jgi:hypothetical protein
MQADAALVSTIHTHNFGTIALIARFTFARVALDKFQKVS